MRLNWLAYNYRAWDGYGRYSGYLVRALRRAGVQVTPHFAGAAKAAAWLLDEWGIDWSIPTISCLPPYYLQSIPRGSGPHWLLTMTEGSECPDGWAEMINEASIERVIVPCQHNADAFVCGGVKAPITVIHGGTAPDEFPVRASGREAGKPYTFLALADRGKRKGWSEAYAAFYLAFGGKTSGDQDVGLVIKCRPGGNDQIDQIRKATDLDKRLTFLVDDFDNIADFYALGDCFVIPSRSEGWGMPHREAAITGCPVITQAYAGMDDGHTHEWASVVRGGEMEPVEVVKDKHIKGQWRRADVDELADLMRQHYEHPDVFARAGMLAAKWLRANQTWSQSAANLIDLMHAEGVFEPEPERVYAWPI